jgi:hypothetical protein
MITISNKNHKMSVNMSYTAFMSALDHFKTCRKPFDKAFYALRVPEREALYEFLMKP